MGRMVRTPGDGTSFPKAKGLLLDEKAAAGSLSPLVLEGMGRPDQQEFSGAISYGCASSIFGEE